MTFKRLVTPLLILGVILTVSPAAFSQATSTVTCGMADAAGTDPIGPFAAIGGGTAIAATDIVTRGAGGTATLLGPSAHSTNTGHTEVIAAGPTRFPAAPGGGTVRVWCANPGVTTSTANPGVVVLQITFGAPLANNTTFPTGTGIRVGNFTGDFANTNVGISSATGSVITIGLGSTPVTSSTQNPTLGIPFTTGVVSTFDLSGVLLGTNGKSGEIDATMTEPSGTANLTATTVSVINTVTQGITDPSIPTSIPSAVVAGVGVGGYTASSGGPAQINSAGLAVKGNFTIKVAENFAEMWQSANQYNGGGAGVFPATASSSTQVLFTFSGVPSGLNITGCKAVLTDVTGTTTNAGTAANAAVVSQSTITAASNTITVNFNGNLDLTAVDVLWLACTSVSANAGTVLPSTPVTVTAELAPLGAAGALTGLATGLIPRFQDTKQPLTAGLTVIQFPPSQTNLLVTYAVVIPGSFNTGIAVSNTTTDIFGAANGGAAPFAGTITFTLYPATGSPITFTSPNVPSGTSYAANVSSMVPAGTTFTGYIFVQANFPQAHGAATIYNTADGEAALSTPVLVVASGGNNIGSGNARVSPESLGQ